MDKRNFDLMFLAEKYKLPEGWQIASWERKNFDTPAEFLEFHGAVCPQITKGPRKGRMNWKKRDRSTEMKLPATFEELKKFRENWSAKTGICHKCQGDGQEWFGWSAKDGNKYRPCTRCGSTGKTL